MVATIESEPQDAPKHLMSRSGRIIKKRAYLDDVWLHSRLLGELHNTIL
jgi:hypothetical protein